MGKMKSLAVVVLCLTVCVSGELLNDSVDKLLESVTALMMADDEEFVKFEDVRMTVGPLDCGDLSVGDLSTLKRTGDVDIGKPPRVRLSGSFGLDKFVLGASSCSLNMGLWKYNVHPIALSVANNSVTVQMTLVSDGAGGCVGQVDDLEVTEFSGLKVASGPGWIHEMEDILFKGVLDLFKKKLLSRLVDKVTKTLDVALGEGKFCKFGPGGPGNNKPKF